MNNEIIENNVIIDDAGYITEESVVYGIAIPLETPHQKKVWLQKITERDKVYSNDGGLALVGVCKDTSRVIAYIRMPNQPWDAAFISDAVMHSERFKASLIEEDLDAEYNADYWNNWEMHMTPEDELVADNEFDPTNEDEPLYIDAATAADLIGVDLEDDFSSYKELLEKATKYIPSSVQEGLEQWIMPNRCGHFYMYAAFGRNMDDDHEVLHSAEWYEPYSVALRLIKAYTEMLYARLSDEAYSLSCMERVARVREERRKPKVERPKAARRAPAAE